MAPKSNNDMWIAPDLVVCIKINNVVLCEVVKDCCILLDELGLIVGDK